MGRGGKGQETLVSGEGGGGVSFVVLHMILSLL